MGEPFGHADLQAWLKPQITAATAPAGTPPYSFSGVDGIYWLNPGELQEPPGRIIQAWHFGGPGLVLTEERGFDTLGFQFHTKGRPKDWADAEALAWLIDGLIVDGRPSTINGTRCLATNRVGNPPTFHSYDPANRVDFTCNYLFTIARH